MGLGKGYNTRPVIIERADGSISRGNVYNDVTPNGRDRRNIPNRPTSVVGQMLNGRRDVGAQPTRPRGQVLNGSRDRVRPNRPVIDRSMVGPARPTRQVYQDRPVIDRTMVGPARPTRPVYQDRPIRTEVRPSLTSKDLRSFLEENINPDHIKTLAKEVFDALLRTLKNTTLEDTVGFGVAGSNMLKVEVTKDVSTRSFGISTVIIPNATSTNIREADNINADTVGSMEEVGTVDTDAFIQDIDELALELVNLEELVISVSTELTNDFVKTEIGGFNIALIRSQNTRTGFVIKIEPGMEFKRHLKDDAFFMELGE